MAGKNALLLVLTAVLVAGPSIGALEPGRGSSKTADVTQGLFLEDADRMMDVTRFGEIENNIFHVRLDDPSVLDAGVGLQLGGLYLGSYYFGNIVDRVKETEERTQTEEIVTGDIQVVGVEETYIAGTNFESTNKENVNFFEALIGFGPIGVALNVYHSDFTTTEEVPYEADSIVRDADGQVVSEDRRTESNRSGNTELWPGIRVGAVLPLDTLTLRPYVGAEVGFVERTVQDDSYTEYIRNTGAGLPAFQGIGDVDTFETRTDLEEDTYTGLNVFAGVIVESGDWEFGIKYGLDTRLNNEDVVENATTSFEANVTNPGDTRTINETERQLEEISRTEHQVQPHVTRSLVAGERLSASLGAVVDVILLSNETIRSESRSQTTEIVDPNPLNSSSVVETETFQVTDEESTERSVEPSLVAAMQYQIVPDRVRLNGGATVRLPGYFDRTETVTPKGVNTTETVTTAGDGTVTRTFNEGLADPRTSTYQRETGWGDATSETLDLNVSYDAGITFDLTENVRLDTQWASYGAGRVTISDFTVQLVVTW